jgi:murein DD-endopeptidase MepM/ murein hydrolase activator NlpD
MRTQLRSTLVFAAGAMGVAAVACRDVPANGGKQDTSTIVPAAGAIADSVRPRTDSLGSGVPAVPPESAAVVGADSGVVEIAPATPTRGGVIFVLARGLSVDAPRCTWKGSPIPCESTSSGVRVLVPLPADDSAGDFTLTIDRPSGARITRRIQVRDRTFGRELVFLDSAHYALARRGLDIARDARAIRQVLSAEGGEQRWAGAWRQPVPDARLSGYGVQRFYYRASDSSRVVAIGPSSNTRGNFGLDTTIGDAKDTPSWRHAGSDIAAKKGSAVHAPAAGIVSDVSDYLLMGHTLVIDHGDGVHSAYFHLDTVLARKGDVVQRGQTIGRVGETGLATGPHLHYGIYVHGADVDPAEWYQMPSWVAGTDSIVSADARGGHRVRR